VFPLFVWLQGVSMAISISAQRKRNASSWDIASKVVTRSLKLFALGLFLNDGTELKEWRVLGVLQYFAMANLVVGLLETFVRPLGSGSDAAAAALPAAASINSGAGDRGSGAGAAPSSLLGALYTDVGRYAGQWAVMLGLGTVYLCVEYLLPVPGCPSGYLGPGGLANQGAYYGMNCTGGAHRAVDVAIFGVHHMYHNIDESTGVVSSAATCYGA
jgi:heparan-alpha-glucosaminide N-acetyltransferase